MKGTGERRCVPRRQSVSLFVAVGHFRCQRSDYCQRSVTPPLPVYFNTYVARFSQPSKAFSLERAPGHRYRTFLLPASSLASRISSIEVKCHPDTIQRPDCQPLWLSLALDHPSLREVILTERYPPRVLFIPSWRLPQNPPSTSKGSWKFGQICHH